ncbi:MAG TPA: polysaccharide biosynthesis/export family protein, partial [Nodosilinea sp.]|nr:polysaccharide biosynthesis/export family protein [Nodosilinea sp.]
MLERLLSTPIGPRRGWLCGGVVAVAVAAIAPLPPASAQTPAQTPAQPSAPLERPYGVLKAGDQVQITVVGFPELSGQQPLSADGTLQLPLVGSLAVAGL